MADYDTDLLLWSERQTDLLRRMGAGERVNDQVDWANVAEEIESLGISQKHQLRSRLGTILLHLIKLQASPATDPRPGWKQTILRERVGIKKLIKDSPSLRPTVPALVDDEINDAVMLALAEMALYGEQPQVDPAELTYTVEQVLGPWMPD
ncbi:MAG TPA: DUF29 domain-containing protein [Acetobacteraceae bacterium]|nr:DUF29 domain-containing protein [Acetobacteraceae bacterium]